MYDLQNSYARRKYRSRMNLDIREILCGLIAINISQKKMGISY